MKRFFTLEYWQDDSWFVGKLKEIPGVFSQGKTIEELKENIIEWKCETKGLDKGQHINSN